MPKFTEFRVQGFWIYYTSTCLGEGIIHVHANEDQRLRRITQLKFWVYKDGSQKLLEYDKSKIKISASQIKDIQNWIKDNLGLIESTWLRNRSDAQFKQK